MKTVIDLYFSEKGTLLGTVGHHVYKYKFRVPPRAKESSFDHSLHLTNESVMSNPILTAASVVT